MFVLRQPENSLNKLLSGLAGASVESKIQQDTQRKRQSALQRVTSQLTPDSSPLDYQRAFANEPDLADEDKKNLMIIPEQLRKNKETQASIEKEKTAAQNAQNVQQATAKSRQV